MEQQNQAILTRNLSQPIAACVFSKDDLKNLCEILQEWCSKASDEEIKHYSPLNPTPEQLNADIAALKSGMVDSTFMKDACSGIYTPEQTSLITTSTASNACSTVILAITSQLPAPHPPGLRPG